MGPRTCMRLIPAHAGKTRARTLRSEPCRAHPRSRGENCTYAMKASTLAGSSPLTRGKPFMRLRDIVDQGLIPAHAGKTFRRLRPGHEQRAHPRSRGENLPAWTSEKSAWGSSPLTRGKRARGRAARWPSGLIPAHAGKTRAVKEETGQPRAHPRSRGENPRVWAGVQVMRGSSPLTRGKPP